MNEYKLCEFCTISPTIVKPLNECLEVQRKELKEELIEKMKQLELEWELREELESMFQQSLFNSDNIKSSSKLLRFYTGFPNYEVFSIVLSFLGRDAASMNKTMLKKQRGWAQKGPC